MKLIAVIAFAAFVACASAAAVAVIPDDTYDGLIQGDDGKIINLEDVDTDGGLPPTGDLPPIRHRRITCDLLSFGIKKWGTPSRLACPIKCVAQGRKGGSCKDGVCVCK